MANIDDLRQDIVAWLYDRPDVAPNIDSFVRLAEAKINNTVRTREMHKTAVIPYDPGGYFPLPDDFLEWREAEIEGRPLELVGEDYFAVNAKLTTSRPTRYFTIRNQRINVAPASATDLTLRYYASIPTLIGQNNWLYGRAPGVYLMTCCGYGAQYLGDDARMQFFFNLAEGEINTLNAADDRNRWARTSRMVPGPKP